VLARPVSDLVDDIGALHKLRNRVAHLEPLLKTGSVLAAFTGLRRVLRDIEPSSERWMLSHQRVTSVAARRVSKCQTAPLAIASGAVALL
jgi:hypothetical protein